MNDKDIEILSTCDGMMDILEDAVKNEQAMPVSLHDAIVKASTLRDANLKNTGLYKIKPNIPKYLCQDCTEPVGYLGGFIQMMEIAQMRSRKDQQKS